VGPDAFRAFTRRVVAALEPDPDVLGVVGLGSTADRGRAPDAHSDHDLWIVVRDGAEDRFRSSQAWLPDAGRIVLAYRETAHGLKVIYDDGHLVEYAVFSLDELEVARANAYRVWLDRADVEARVARCLRRGRDEPPPDLGWLFGQALAHLLVGAERAARGELLSGHRFVRELAVARLLELIVRLEPSVDDAEADDLDPYRRAERTHPARAAAIEAAVRKPVGEAALALLDQLDELAVRAESGGVLPKSAREAVRRRLLALGSEFIGPREG
jgi:hypothetical protein